MSHLELLNRNVQLTHEWINELDTHLGWASKARSFRLLRVVLHSLRDCLPPAEAADFAAQLPTLLRGVLYEHWRPMARQPHNDFDAFIGRVNGEFPDDVLDDSERAVMICFDLFSRRISAGECEQVRNALPHRVRRLWQGADNIPQA